MEMLTNCQVEVLEVDDMSILLKSSDCLDILVKSLKFVTKLIIGQSITYIPKIFIDLYCMFCHLDTLVYKRKPLTLLCYPPNIVIEPESDAIDNRSYSNFLQNLAKYSRQYPLSSVKIKKYIFFDHLQQFLITAGFSEDAEIFAKFYMSNSSLHQVYLTYIERNIFQFEVYSPEAMVVTVDQKITGENDRILVLSRMNFVQEHATRNSLAVSFNVTSASSGNRPIYSGILTKNEQSFKLENVRSNEWIKVKIISRSTHRPVRYSKGFLNTHFPRYGNISHLNYLDKINNVLGTQFGITKATLKNINAIFDNRKLNVNVSSYNPGSRPRRR
uniref:Uncharacterized protein n=1 Tax=Panagrolaimus sp. JU765 TaxID=591449 RepID=A0AC34RBI8_9BILA